MDNQTTTPNNISNEPNSKLQLMKADEVARLLKIDSSSVRRMAREGRIPSVKFGKSIRIRLVDLEKFIEDHLG